MQQNNILMPERYGFRPKHSTQHQFHHLVKFLSDKFNTKIIAAAIFLDVAKSFDKVWQERLHIEIN